MTHEELIEKVAKSINGVENKWMAPTKQHIEYATVAISTILTALQEPTEEMMQAIGATSIQRLVWQAMLSASPLTQEKTNERT